MGCARGSLLVILVFFLYKCGESFLQPTLRLFIVETVCLTLAPVENRSSCRHVEVTTGTGVANRLRGLSFEIENANQALSANYLLAYRIMLNLPAIFLSLYCGPWSDRVGRKLPMFLPAVGGVISCVIFTLCLKPSWISPLVVVLIGAAIYGLFGKSAVITMSCNSYITDVTSEEARTRMLGGLLGVNFVGIFVGSLLVGLYQYFGSIGPALSTVSIINCLVVVLVVFGVKESRMPGSRSESVEAKKEGKLAICCDSVCRAHFIVDSLKYLVRKREGNIRRHLILLFLSMFVNQLCKSGEQDTIMLFVQHSPLNWTGDRYGYYLCLYYACMGLNLLLVLPLLTRWFQPRDTTLIMIGLIMKTVRLLMTAFAGDSSAMIYSAAVVGSSAGFIVSATKSLITKVAADSDDIGKTFALLSSMEACSNLLGPSIFNSMYAATVGMYPGFVFVIDACIHLCLLCFFLRIHFELEDEQQDQQIKETDFLVNKE